MTPERKKQLERLVEEALKLTNGEMPIRILVRDAEEESAVKRLLKGRRKSKAISAKISKDAIGAP